jgi:hypothetical protein
MLRRMCPARFRSAPPDADAEYLEAVLAAAERHTLRRTLYDRLVDADLARREVLEIEVRVISPNRKGLSEVSFEIPLRYSKLSGEKRFGKSHDFSVSSLAADGR